MLHFCYASYKTFLFGLSLSFQCELLLSFAVAVVVVVELSLQLNGRCLRLHALMCAIVLHNSTVIAAELGHRITCCISNTLTHTHTHRRTHTQAATDSVCVWHRFACCSIFWLLFEFALLLSVVVWGMLLPPTSLSPLCFHLHLTLRAVSELSSINHKL